MSRLDGWKAIAGYLRRDKRTAQRWAAHGGLPVRRMPGPGRGSVYALAEEVDAWLEQDRARAEPDHVAPVVAEPLPPPAAKRTAAPWRRRWIAGAFSALGVIVVGVGAMTLRLSRPKTSDPGPVFADAATKAMFFQATYDWNLRTAGSLRRAVLEYGDTIAHDPRVPAAYVGLANSYLLLREYDSLSDAEAYGRAEAAAKAAVLLEPRCADAHRALAFIAFWWRRDRVVARSEFDRALQLKPDDPLTHHWLANALLANGELDAALREIDRARDLDPDSTSIVSDRASILYSSGRHAEALARLRELVREQPQDVSSHRTLASIALYEGRSDEFIDEFTASARLRSDYVGLDEAQRWRSARMDARSVEDSMLLDAQRAGREWFKIARVAALTGRGAEAKRALAQACNANEAATISASSDLWLSRSLTHADVEERCGRTLSLL